jgi:hypothetical protein
MPCVVRSRLDSFYRAQNIRLLEICTQNLRAGWALQMKKMLSFILPTQVLAGRLKAAVALSLRSLLQSNAIGGESASILFGGGFWRSDSVPGRKAGQRAIFHVQTEQERMLQEEQEFALSVWIGHPNLHIIDSTEDFLLKVTKALNLIQSFLPACCHEHPITRTEPPTTAKTTGDAGRVLAL